MYFHVVLCLNNVAGQGLDLENDTAPPRQLRSQSSHTEIMSCIFASVEMGNVVKNLFLLQENLILGLLCQAAAGVWQWAAVQL